MPKKKSKSKVIAFTIADQHNMGYLELMVNSLRKFHSEKELPLVVIGKEALPKMLAEDKDFFYRATPKVAYELMSSYDAVIKLDADQIITGDLSHTWEGNFDIGAVFNSNPREFKKYPVSVWNIHPQTYLNCGFVVMKSLAFVDHWLHLCLSPHFEFYQMREQDLLNIMVYYGNYKVNLLDNNSKWHGLRSKGYWADIELKDDKLWLKKNDEWPKDEDKQIVCLHAAGGNDPKKWNFNTQFDPTVTKWLKKLTTKDET